MTKYTVISALINDTPNDKTFERQISGDERFKLEKPEKPPYSASAEFLVYSYFIEKKTLSEISEREHVTTSTLSLRLREMLRRTKFFELPHIRIGEKVSTQPSRFLPVGQKLSTMFDNREFVSLLNQNNYAIYRYLTDQRDDLPAKERQIHERNVRVNHILMYAFQQHQDERLALARKIFDLYTRIDVLNLNHLARLAGVQYTEAFEFFRAHGMDMYSPARVELLLTAYKKLYNSDIPRIEVARAFGYKSFGAFRSNFPKIVGFRSLSDINTKLGVTLRDGERVRARLVDIAQRDRQIYADSRRIPRPSTEDLAKKYNLNRPNVVRIIREQRAK